MKSNVEIESCLWKFCTLVENQNLIEPEGQQNEAVVNRTAAVCGCRHVFSVPKHGSTESKSECPARAQRADDQGAADGQDGYHA